MTAKKTKKPASKPTTARGRKAMLKQIGISWEEHEDWPVGKLIANAASISRGELRSNPHGVSDREILSGLRALIPDEDE